MCVRHVLLLRIGRSRGWYMTNKDVSHLLQRLFPGLHRIRIVLFLHEHFYQQFLGLVNCWHQQALVDQTRLIKSPTWIQTILSKIALRLTWLLHYLQQCRQQHQDNKIQGQKTNFAEIAENLLQAYQRLHCGMSLQLNLHPCSSWHFSTEVGGSEWQAWITVPQRHHSDRQSIVRKVKYALCGTAAVFSKEKTIPLTVYSLCQTRYNLMEARLIVWLRSVVRLILSLWKLHSFLRPLQDIIDHLHLQNAFVCIKGDRSLPYRKIQTKIPKIAVFDTLESGRDKKNSSFRLESSAANLLKNSLKSLKYMRSFFAACVITQQKN